MLFLFKSEPAVVTPATPGGLFLFMLLGGFYGGTATSSVFRRVIGFTRRGSRSIDLEG